MILAQQFLPESCLSLEIKRTSRSIVWAGTREGRHCAEDKFDLVRHLHDLFQILLLVLITVCLPPSDIDLFICEKAAIELTADSDSPVTRPLLCKSRRYDIH